MRGKKQQAATAVEDPADKEARERERAIAQQERRSVTQDGAAGLTSDLRAIYGLRGYRGSLFRQPAPAPAAAPKAVTPSAPAGSPMAFYNNLDPISRIAASIFGAKDFGFPAIKPAVPTPAAPPPDRSTGYTSPITNASKNNAMSGGTNNKNSVSTRSTPAPSPSTKYSANDRKGNAKKK